MKKISLGEALLGIEDTRREQSVLHLLHEILLIVLLGVMCGATFEHGGTGKGITQSFDMLNPMYGFTGKDTMEKGQEFVASLDDNEKEKLSIAQKYYESELMLPENIMQLLKKKVVTNDEAKKIF